MSRICIVGDWHQAIVVGACLADAGHDVRGAVSDESTAARLRQGEPPVHEPELPELMARGLAAGRLQYTASFEEALRGAAYAFISIDTPVSDSDEPELESVVAAARRVGCAIGGETVLVITAQVPVGTCEQLRDVVAGESGRAVQVAYIPEFLRLGHAVRTFIEADRFIIGCDDDAVAAALEAIYAPLGRPVLRMGLRSAEMTKHACNAFLAASISFANEIADLCAETGADIDAVTAGMKLDRRIGEQAFLSAGLGFAGGTLGRDLRALQRIGAARGIETHMTDAALRVNGERASLVRRRLERVYDSVHGLRVAVLGLTYKAGTSTLRRSIALDIIRELTALGAEVRAFDPLATMDGVVDPPPFTRVSDPLVAADGADAAVLVTEWEGVDQLDLAALRMRMRRAVFIDTRNRFDPAAMAEQGFIYLGVGRGTVESVILEASA
ncbi:MAG: nucleotide sugar dehydrogenase [Gemmatimonadota bacterium]